MFGAINKHRVNIISLPFLVLLKFADGNHWMMESGTHFHMEMSVNLPMRTKINGQSDFKGRLKFEEGDFTTYPRTQRLTFI